MRVLLLFIFLVASLDNSFSLRRRTTKCPVYNTGPTKSVLGNLYNGTFTYRNGLKKVKSKIELCCLESVKDKAINFTSTTAKTSCCQQLEGSVCYSRYRSCPGYSCIVVFSDDNGEKSVLTLKSPPEFFACTNKNKTRQRGRIVKSSITQYKSARGCKDASKKILITSVKTGKPADAYHMCCSVDITTNFGADPRKDCCGLAASLAPNFISQGQIAMDTPPCCRKLNGFSTCDTTYIQSKPRFRFCAALAGSADTPNLSEDLPALAPLHYTYKVESSGEGYNSKTVFACDKQGNKFLYSIQDSNFALPYKINVCCSKDIFYESAKTIIDDCCITYADFPTTVYEPSYYQCSVQDNHDTGFISNKKFVYKPCKYYACPAINKYYGQFNDRYILKPFNVSVSKVAPLYGVYKWYLNKYLSND